jgi:uncharacterized protein
MRKTVTILLGLGAAAVAAAPVLAAKYELAVAGAGPASLAYTLVAGLAENTNKRSKDVRVTPETSAGYVENVRLLGRGETELALIGGTQAFQGLRAIGPYKGEPKYTDIRGVAVAYSGNISWNAKDGITSVPELAGKTVSLGPPGSFIAYVGELILDAYGIKDKVKILRLSYSEGSRAFVDGRVDAFVGGPAPYPAVMQAGAQKKINILSVDADHLKKIQKLAPLGKATIKAGTYDWLKQDVDTVGYLTYLVANKKVPDQAVYDLLKANLSPEGIKYLKTNHKIWSMWETGSYITNQDAFALEGLKMHPGAVKYWKEQGVKLPASILP